MAELPSGTVTFLFTDLEGSSRLREHTNAMREESARHDASLRDAMAPPGGTPKSTTSMLRQVRDSHDHAVSLVCFSPFPFSVR